MITVPAELVPPLNSEVRKATTLRPNLVLATALPAVALVASTVTALVAGPANPKANPVTGGASVGLYLGIIAALVGAAYFGATATGSEYRYQTMPVTASFTMDRDRLVAAKFLVIGAFALAAAVVVELVATAALFGFGRGKTEFGLRLVTVLGGGLLAVVCWSLIAAGLGLILRKSTVAIAVVLGWLVLAEPFVWLVAGALGLKGFVTLLPGSATIAAVAAGSFPDSDFLAPTPAAMIVLLLWTVGVAGAGWWAVRTRDL
ncbi:ABC transporter permease subunit [Nocardia sp. XZ_19_385]|uniref:ABC transporter permease subunit n=1 Tax=Nocardia sp. XZ_19_385 TaxID=2769488 RepID=UPI00188E053A|nr:ABC transporter permease subunit [Nocardia sp. XZ_19_385]